MLSTVYERQKDFPLKYFILIVT